MRLVNCFRPSADMDDEQPVRFCRFDASGFPLTRRAVSDSFPIARIFSSCPRGRAPPPPSPSAEQEALELHAGGEPRPLHRRRERAHRQAPRVRPGAPRALPAPGDVDEDKKRFMAQAAMAPATPAPSYVANARKLLEDSKLGVNPFTAGPLRARRHRRRLRFRGAQEARAAGHGIGSAAFVLVAGGSASASAQRHQVGSLRTIHGCHVSSAVRSLHPRADPARRARCPRTVRRRTWHSLAIMTSDDTHAKTLDLASATITSARSPHRSRSSSRRRCPA